MKRYVLICDHDTNALTSPERLETLYRPFLDLHLPVNLAVIPWVRTNLRNEDGEPPGFLAGTAALTTKALPIGHNEPLVRYLQEHPIYHIAQHGCHHEPDEFDSPWRSEIGRRLSQGSSMMASAGLGTPLTFVPPNDRLSAAALDEAASRYRVVSCGGFPWLRLPWRWWPANLMRILRADRHMHVEHCSLLSHVPGLLSLDHPASRITQLVEDVISRSMITVIVAHWWEFYPHGEADGSRIDALHAIAEWLVSEPDIEVVTYEEVHRRGIIPALAGSGLLNRPSMRWRPGSAASGSVGEPAPPRAMSDTNV